MQVAISGDHKAVAIYSCHLQLPMTSLLFEDFIYNKILHKDANVKKLATREDPYHVHKTLGRRMTFLTLGVHMMPPISFPSIKLNDIH